MYQLIALDMDGTLLDDQKQILPSSAEAIKKLIMQERLFVYQLVADSLS